MPLTIKKLAKKAKANTLSPQELYRQKRSASGTASIGPKEQTFKIDQDVKRGGTIGATVGKAKPKSSFTKSTGNMTAGRSRNRGR